ncbi:MAG: PAS domain S-box protein, partial [Candidatus Cloacimonetes bacterium]|nr:PAS domain S-box protein [Candidatus Cloacimonadota bacterium]
TFPILIYSSAILKDNKPVGLRGIIVDITDRKQTEKVLRESEEKYRQLAETAKDVIMVLDLKGNVKYINQEGINLSGYSKEEILKMNVNDVLSADNIPISDNNFAKRIAGDKSLFIYEIDFLNIKGDKIPVEIKSSLITEHGKPSGVLITARDITERKKMELELIRLSDTFRMSTDSIIISNLDGKITDVNEATLKMYGTDNKLDLIGKISIDLIDPEDKKKAPAIMKEVMEKGYSKDNKYNVIIKDGSKIPVEMSVSIMKGKDGKPIGFVGITKDITERKKAEEELNRNFQQQKLLSEVSYLFTKLGKFDENINEVICLIGEYSGVSRVYVFENFNNGEFTKNTYEWCNKNIEPQIDNLQEIPYKMVPSWKKFLTEKGMVLSSNILELPQDLIDILEPQNIKSIFVLPIYVKDKFFGFMGFDDCEKNRIWDKSEIELLKTITNVISTIFERRLTEESLKESEEKYRSMINDVLDASQTGVFVLDSEFKIVWINHSIEKYFGLKREDVIGKDKRQLIRSSIKDIFKDPKTFRKKVFATYNNNTYIESFECHVLPDKKHRERLLEHRSQPIQSGLYKGGRVEYYTDISESKRAEEALKESEEKYRNLVENIEEGIISVDQNEKFIYVNPAATKIFGYSEKELL